MNKVLAFPASNTLTPEQALASASQEDLSDVMILGYRQDDGTLYIRSSRMSRTDALWLSEKLRDHALNG